MHSHASCGNGVYSYGAILGTTCVRSYTAIQDTVGIHSRAVQDWVVVRLVVRVYEHIFSQAASPSPTLLYVTLYPLSTAPITISIR